MDRVQQIVADEQPFIYLVYPNALQAIAPQFVAWYPRSSRQARSGISTTFTARRAGDERAGNADFRRRTLWNEQVRTPGMESPNRVAAFRQEFKAPHLPICPVSVHCLHEFQ